jgi:hypothetical protein
LGADAKQRGVVEIAQHQDMAPAEGLVLGEKGSQ